MRRETQADHLRRIMQSHTTALQYELAFPLVSIPCASLERLSVDDVLILEFKTFESILIKDESICAKVICKNDNKRITFVVNDIEVERLQRSNSKKYQTVKLSFGHIESRRLQVGQGLDMSQMDLTHISLVSDDKMIAKGTLISVNNEIAVKIDKVEK